MTRLRRRLIERLRACDAKVGEGEEEDDGGRAAWASLLPTTTRREEETEDDDVFVREETMRTESAGYDAYGDGTEDVPVRSLSPRAEYEAALAVVHAPTMPASLPPASADRGQSIPTFEDDEHAVGSHERETPLEEPRAAAMTSSIPFEANEESQMEMATMEAAPVGSDSGRRRTTTGSVSGRKRSRINETPSVAAPVEDAEGRNTEECAGRSLLPASAGKALRFSVDASLSLNDDDLLAAAEAHEASTRAVNAVPTSRSRYECTLDVRVRDGTCASVVFAKERLGVVVQAKEAKEWVDVLVFSMDEGGSAPRLVGSCVVHASGASGRRTSRRRSSLGAAASGAPDARAIRLSPSGAFVFAPGASDGVRILSVTFRDDENDDGVSDARLTSPSSTSTKKKSKRQKRSTSSEVARLECSFKVERAATWTRGDEFFLGAAGADGRCVVWSWSTTNSNDGDDEAFVRNEPSARVDFAPVLFRGVAPNPGSVTNLSWISSAESTASPRLLGVIDDGLACVWNVEKKTCERVCFTADHRIERLLPVRYDGCEPTSDDDTKAPIPALALTHAKERKGPEMVSESSSSDGSEDFIVKPPRVRAALVRAHGVSIGAPLFPAEAFDSVATLDYDSTTACVGTHDGSLIIWDIDSGKILHEARIADDDDDDDAADDDVAESVSSVACRADVLVAAAAGNRTRVFRRRNMTTTDR